MVNRYPVFCDTPELAVECTLAAAEIGLALDPQVGASPLEAALAAAQHHAVIAVALAEAPTVEALIAAQSLPQKSGFTLAIAILGDSRGAAAAREIASDLGMIATREIAPLLAVLALRDAGAAEPWSTSIRSLATADRTRLRTAIDGTQRVTGQLRKLDQQRLGWSSTNQVDARALGTAAVVAEAILALKTANHSPQALQSTIADVDERAVLDVLFGPARALSDPASKAALVPYGIPVPSEELCSSASRAAAEATRLGFPVRIALASPDLRVWQHPDLVVDMVDNAARVRETFRLLTALAQSRAPDARILGVTVAATTDCHALLHVAMRPLPMGLTETRVGFADAHGIAAADATTTVLPTSVANIERILSRLRGSSLILGGSTQQRRAVISEIADVLLRAAAFVTTHAHEVSGLELRPVAVLTGGGIEVREACVTVNDTFEQTYQRASGLG